MKSISELILIMIVGVLFFLSGYLFSYSTQPPCPPCSLHTSCPAPNISIPDCPNTSCNCPEVSQLKEITHAVYIERPYHYPYWDCSEMSQALQDRLENAGYDTRRFCNNKHCWVEVRDKNRWGIILEATGGFIPTPYDIQSNKEMYRHVYKDV